MSTIKYLDKTGLTYFWGKVKGIVNPKMDKVNAATSGHLAKFGTGGQVVDGGDTADYAKNLIAPVVQDAEFVYRKTGGSLAVDGTAGAAEIQKIKGKSLVWNQVYKNSRQNGTVVYDVTFYTVDSSSFYYSGTATQNNDITQTILTTTGHKYFIACRNADDGIEISGSVYTSKGAIITAQFNNIQMGVLFISGKTYSNATVYRPIVIDLTLLFNGNVPEGFTVADFEAMFPEPYYDYNPGTLISNDASAIETVGFNLWDEEWEVGGISSTDGTNNNSVTNRIRSKNYIPVFGGLDYYVKNGGSGTVWVFIYDADKNYITYFSANNAAFTPSATTAYIRICPDATYGYTYNHDICINLSDPAKNGTYEPYKKTITTLNLTGLTGKKDGVGESVVVFPEGLRWTDSTNHDEIYGNVATRKTRLIHLYDLDWMLSNEAGSSSVFYARIYEGTVPFSNVICTKYSKCYTSTIALSDMEDKSMQMRNWHTQDCINIRDTDYSTASDFKNAMTGVYAIIKMTTPEEYILDSTPDYTYPVDGDGTERRLPEDTSSSIHAPFRADILYALNGSATLRNLDANYVRNDNIKQDIGNNENMVMSQAAVTRQFDIMSQRINDLPREITDLSYFDPKTNSRTLRQNTANCYVIRSNGTYIFPLVYGNGIKNGIKNPAAYTRLDSNYTANFVNHLGNPITDPWLQNNLGCNPYRINIIWWSDGKAAQSGAYYSVPISFSMFPGEDMDLGIWNRPDGKYAYFTVNASSSLYSKGGVIVLGVYDESDNILWSWTLWLTSDSLAPETIVNYTGVEYQMMPENLLTIWDDKSNLQCHSALYQWGRKDVVGLPAAYNSNSQAAIIYGSVSTPDANGLGTYGVADDADAGGTVRSVANSIKMPHKFFLEYDNTNYNWNNLPWFNNFWNAAETLSSDLADNQLTAIKTIYDPCPVGYMVPGPRAWTGFTSTGTNSSTASEFSVVGSFSNGWKFKKNSSDANGTFYPASGCRFRASGGLGSVGSGGGYWSFAPNSQTNARNLNFNSGSVYPLNDSNRAYGFSVRPSVELT